MNKAQLAQKRSELAQKRAELNQQAQDLEDQHEREDRVRLAKILPLGKAADMIIEAVDSSFPASLERELDRCLDALDDCAALQEVLRTGQDRDREDKFFAAIEGVDQNIITDAYGWALTFVNYHLAIGFAAGVRATGASRETTRTMLLGLLRNFERGSERVKP
jgi:hypothetical protein